MGIERALGIRRTVATWGQDDGRHGLTSRWALAGGPALFQLVLLAIAAGLVLVPIGALLVGAVSTAPPGAPGNAFTMDYLSDVYLGLVRDPWMRGVVGNTLLTAIPASIAASILGTFAAWAVARTDVPGRQWFRILLVLPMFYSPLVDVIGWSVLADGKAGLINVLWRETTGHAGSLVNVFSVPGIVFVMTVFFTPYVFIMNLPVFMAMDPTLEEAGATSGANLIQRLRHITLPVLAPGLLASFVLVFTLAMEQFSIPGFLGSYIDFQTLAYAIYAKTNYVPAEPNRGAAIGTLLLLFAIVFLMLYRYTIRRSERYVTVGGKGHKSAVVPLGPMRGMTTLVLSLMVLVGAVLPLASVTFRSLLPVRVANLSDVRVGVANFAQAFKEPAFFLALQNSVILAVGASLACAALGWMIAREIVRRKSRLIALADYLIALPIAIPGTVFGVGMLWGYVATPLYLTVGILLVAFVTRYTVYAVRMIAGGSMQISRSLEEAGAVAGAGPALIVRRISGPLLKPVVASAVLLIFLTVMRELSTSIVLYGFNSVTMPILTWTRLDDGFYGIASAISLVQMLIVLVFVIVLRKLFGGEVRTEAQLKFEAPR
jgi:iron(III) transport system permease protein